MLTNWITAIYLLISYKLWFKPFITSAMVSQMVCRWIKAAYLLKRYKVCYNPIIKCGVAYYATHVDDETGKILRRVIHVNPFDSNFWCLFCHELGHHVYKKYDKTPAVMTRLRLSGTSYKLDFNGRDFALVLEEEVFASRFSLKFSRKFREVENKEKLISCFYTYFKAGYKCLSEAGQDSTSYINHVEVLLRKLENT